MSVVPEVLVLKQPGHGVSIRVTACDKMKIGNYPEVEFAGVDADGRFVAVRVPQKAADRQLDRLQMTYAQTLGQSLFIGRSANGQDPSKPFWDVTEAEAPITAPQKVPNVAPAAPAARAAQATPASAPVAPIADEQSSELQNGALKKSDLYGKITDHVLDKIVPKYAAKGIPLTQEGTAAIVATLYISATR